MGCTPDSGQGVWNGRQGAAAGKDEIADAGGAQRGFLLAGPACQVDMLCARSLKGLGGRYSVPGIKFIGRTEARRCSAGRLECGRKRSRVGKALGVDRLDAAGLEKALAE